MESPIIILQLYEKVSGQKMSASKTSIFFSQNASNVDKEQIQGIAGIPINSKIWHLFEFASIGG